MVKDDGNLVVLKVLVLVKVIKDVDMKVMLLEEYVVWMKVEKDLLMYVEYIGEIKDIVY